MFAALLFSSSKTVSATSLYATLVLSACSTTPEEVGKPPARPTAGASRSRPARPAASAPVAARVVRLTNDSLAGQPFGAEPTVLELLTAGGQVLSRRATRNMHEAGQVDTVLLLRHQGNVFEFYRTPDKDLLRDATITNFEPAYGRRLRTRLAAAHRPASGASDSVRIGDSERTNFVSLTYQNGRLRTVHVEPYVD